MRYEQILMWAMFVSLFAGVGAYNLAEHSQNLHATVAIFSTLIVVSVIGLIINKKNKF